MRYSDIALICVFSFAVIGSHGSVRFTPEEKANVEVGKEFKVTVEILSPQTSTDVKCASQDTSIFDVVSYFQTRKMVARVGDGVGEGVGKGVGYNVTTDTIERDASLVVDLILRGNKFGRSLLLCSFKNNNETMEKSKYHIIVTRSKGIELLVFKIFVNIIIIVINLGMGCELNLQVVKDSLSRPIAPAIGLFCQFLCMPVISLTIIYMFSLRGAFAFGLFTLGCAPGGGNSNFLTYIFGGNVSLSITMTFISNLGALLIMPIWLLTIGNKILKSSFDGDDLELSSSIEIPFKFIIISILLNTGPLIIGVLISRFRKSLATKIRHLLKSFLIFTFCFFVTAGVYIHREILTMITLDKVLICVLLPYSGFFIGMSLSKLACRVKADIICISLETGIQNLGVAVVICVNTLPHPEEEYALLGLLIIAILSPIPMYLLIMIIKIRECLNKNKEIEETKEDELKINEKSKQDYSLVNMNDTDNCVKGSNECKS